MSLMRQISYLTAQVSIDNFLDKLLVLSPVEDFIKEVEPGLFFPEKVIQED